MMAHDLCARIGASLSVQGSMVSEIFKTQADGAAHGSGSSVTAAQVSRMVNTELGMMIALSSVSVAKGTVPQTGSVINVKKL